MLSGIRWIRVVAAAVLAEIGVIAVLLIVIVVYSRLIAPGMSDADYQTLGARAGYYVAPTAGFVTTILAVLWACRKLESRFVANGLMVGVVSVVITSPFFFTARAEDRVMYGVAFLLRLAGGYVGGMLAQRQHARSARPTSSVVA
jgi:hypothetical protein